MNSEFAYWRDFERLLIRVCMLFTILVVASLFLIVLTPALLIANAAWTRLVPFVPHNITTYASGVYHGITGASNTPYDATRKTLELASFASSTALVIIGFVAFCVTWRQLREVQKSRLAPVYMEISHRWDSDGLSRSRSGISARMLDGTIKNLLPRNNADPAYHDFLIVVSFLEDIGLLCRKRYLSLEDIADIIGSSIIYYIDALRPQIDAARASEESKITREAKYANTLWLRDNLLRIRQQHPYRRAM